MMSYFIDSRLHLCAAQYKHSRAAQRRRGNDNGYKDKQSGQVVLITLLILVIVLTVGLSIITRSVTDVKISQQSQESARAFWVAQGGLEKAIRANSSLSGVGDIKYDVTKTDLGGNVNNEFVYPEKLLADTPATIWFVNHDNGLIGSNFSNPQKVTLYWGDSSQKTAAEITFVYDQSGKYQLLRYAYDPDEVTTGSNFSPVADVGYTVGGKSFHYSSDYNPPDEIKVNGMPKMYFARVRLMGNSQADSFAVKVDTSHPLPSQGSCFESTSEVTVSKITKKLTSCQLWSVYPAIFDNGLFSGNNI